MKSIITSLVVSLAVFPGDALDVGNLRRRAKAAEGRGASVMVLIIVIDDGG